MRETNNEDLFNLIVVPKVNLDTISPITLAFYGDAFHTLMVRKYFLDKGMATSNNLHKTCSKFCSAKGQATALDFITPLLSAEELEIVRRARNSKTHNPPKNCDLEIYKKATSFEALLAYLIIKNEAVRAYEMIKNSIEETTIKN